MQPSAEVEHLLRAAGWYPGRRVPARVAEWRAALEAGGRFILHPAAERVLLEYGGLAIDVDGPGRDVARSPLRLDPTLADGEEDRLLDRFPRLHGRSFFPLGEVAGGHAFLAVDRTGVIVELMDTIYAEWPSFAAALPALLLGWRVAGINEAAV